MSMNPKRPVSAILSAAMLLGISSPPVQALDTSTPTDSRLCSEHTAHTPECGGIDGECKFVCPEHTPQILPELHEDMVDGEPTKQPESSESTEQTDLIPLIPALPLTPAKTNENTDSTPLVPIEPMMQAPGIQSRARMEVYTSATQANHVHSGDGSYANPYNLFDDAVKNTMPGGTIVIKNKAFLNTLNETGSLPYIIDKDIIIRSEDPNNPAQLQVRSGGIVLGADVTFENVNLNFENRVHDAIFANGHKLTLKNVLRSNGSREVDLFGGQLYEGDRPYAADKKGTNSEIIIKMNDPHLAPLSSLHLGNVYAGSMNGTFDGNVTIKVSDTNQGKTKFMGQVYASGAKEADPGNMLDIKEPDPPEADATKYPVSGTVTMDFDSLPLRGSSQSPMLIDGKTGTGGSKTNLSISVNSLTGNLKLKDISDLTINKGAIQPTGDSTAQFDSIKINAGAELDLSKANPKDFTTETLSGQGTLTLKKDGSLNVTTAFNDSTLTFQTEGAWNGKSGLVTDQHTYVTTPSGNGQFKFQPHQAQTGWTFVSENSAWKVKKPADMLDTPILTKMSINPKDTYKTIYQHIPANEEAPEFPLQFEFAANNNIEENITAIEGAFTCSVTTELSTEPIEFLYDAQEGYYTAEDMPFAFYIVPEGYQYSSPVLTIQRLSNAQTPGEFSDIAIGTYEIEIGYPAENGNMLTTKAYLTSLPNPPEISSPDVSNSQITITPSSSSATFGDKVTVTANITKSIALIDDTIAQDKAYLYINGQYITEKTVLGSNLLFDTIEILDKNHFKAGNNQITVIYGGGTLDSGQFNGSTGTTSIMVEKIAPDVKIADAPITKTYDGIGVTYIPKNLTVTVLDKTISDPKVSIIYKTESGVVLDQPPVLPGTYKTEIQVAEGDTYTETSIDGPQITIEKATPKVTLSHSFASNGKVVLEATVQGVESGIVPTGIVSFSVSGTATQNTSQDVKYGVAKLEIEKPSAGAHTIQATYKASTDSKAIYDDTNASATSELNIAADHKPLTGITLNHQTLTLKKDATADLDVIFQPQDASNKKVTWVSMNNNVATVTDNGQVTAKATGTATIEARAAEGGYIASCTVTVSETDVAVSSVEINVPNPIMQIGQTDQLSAIIKPLNATARDVRWTSNSSNVVVEETTGKITAKTEGSAQIMATVGGQSKTCTIEVTDNIPVKEIKLNTRKLSLKANQTVQLVANLLPDNATSKDVTWESNSTDVTVDPDGWITSSKVGATANITAVSKDGTVTSDVCVVTIVAADASPILVKSITITPTNPTLDVNQELKLTATVSPGDATNPKVRWESQHQDIVTVDEYTGIVTAKAPGKGTITATAIDGSAKTTSIAVTVNASTSTPPPVPSATISISPNIMKLEIGKSEKFTAALSPTDSSDIIIWSIENGDDKIDLDANGTVIGRAAGTATVKAQSTKHPTIFTTATVQVSEATPPVIPITGVQIDGGDTSLKTGTAHTFTAKVLPATAPQTVTWSASPSGILSVDASTGRVTTLKAGKVTLTATSTVASDKSGSITVTVADVPVTEVKITEAPLSLREGQSAQLTVKVSPDDATNPAVKWESDDTNVLSVTQDGYVTAHRKGTATITVTSVAHPELKDSRTISVTASSSGGGGSSGGGSSKPSKPDKKPDKKPETKPETPKPETQPAIPPTVKPELPKPGVPVINTAPPVNPTLNTTFNDLPQTHWAAEPVKDVVSRGLFVGTEKDNFSPDESMTRGMLVTVLHRLAGEPIVQSSNQFTDVGRTYYTDAVTWANQNKIVSGTSANTFGPNRMVTREELVVMLYRLANPVPDSSTNLASFTDAGKISGWASAPMQWAVQTGILKGSDGALLPQKELSRAEAASLISRFTDKILTH